MGGILQEMRLHVVERCTPARRRARMSRPASQMAGILSNDMAFAEFVATACAFPGDPATYIRGTCEIASRRELDTDPTARAKFDAMKTAFDAWSGRIAAPR